MYMYTKIPNFLRVKYKFESNLQSKLPVLVHTVYLYMCTKNIIVTNYKRIVLRVS